MAKKVVLIVIGAVLALLGTALTVGGAVLLVITGGDGYLGTGGEQIGTPTRALVSEPQVLDTDAPGDATVRVRVTPTDGDPVFIGVGPTGAVQAYLAGTSYDELRDLQFGPIRYVTARSDGERVPPTPADQPLWTARSTGTGEQTVEVRLDTPDYRVVVMNADSSPEVDVRLSVGIRVPLLRRLGIGLLIGGVLALLTGLASLIWGVRTRVPRPTPAWTGSAGWTPFPHPPGTSPAAGTPPPAWTPFPGPPPPGASAGPPSAPTATSPSVGPHPPWPPPPAMPPGPPPTSSTTVPASPPDASPHPDPHPTDPPSWNPPQSPPPGHSGPDDPSFTDPTAPSRDPS